jgi:transposase
MREGISIEVSAADRGRLERLVADRSSPQKHVWRARIVLATAAGCGTAEIMRRARVSKPTVWRWQARFMREGVAGLLRDKTRKPGLPPLPATLVDRVVALTLGEPPGEATHWTGRAMAAATGISLRSVQRIWAAHRLEPHRIRRFKLSRDPAFAAKLRDVVGLYLDPPAHSLVLSVDEKSQIQALDRTQPGLPLKKGRAGTMTHDYVRHGTTTLFAALNVLDGPVGSADIPPGDRAQGPMVSGRCMQRHRAAASPRDPMSEGPPVSRPARRHQEFIRFLNRIEAAVPAGKLVHAILDNYAAHKHPKVRSWLSRHRRWTFHLTPTSCSWANAVEGFFARLTRRRLQRGAFHSLVDLQAAINRYLNEHNQRPKPFVWTADPDRIIEKVNRGYQALASNH